jgi:hypothetical protein
MVFLLWFVYIIAGILRSYLSAEQYLSGVGVVALTRLTDLPFRSRLLRVIGGDSEFRSNPFEKIRSLIQTSWAARNAELGRLHSGTIPSVGLAFGIEREAS